MSFRPALTFFVLFMALLLCVNLFAADKQTARIVPLDAQQPIAIAPKGYSVPLRAVDSCAVYEGDNPHYLIYPWVEGDELFKAYQNPGATCDNPYPFTIDRVHVILYLTDTASIVLSADVELVDNSVPSCPHPGQMLTLTQGYEYQIPEKNLYFITVPLDSPIVVDGPYFVGLYIGPQGNPTTIAVVTDSIPVGCVSYNDWGNGYVDLDTVYTNPDGTGYIKTFPGRLVLYSSGYAGGSGGGTEPAPAAEFINPANNQFIGASVDLWANDAAGSAIIEKADFYYNSGGSWIFIGSDTSDDPPLRNGATASGTGDGLSFQWSTQTLTEGDYQLRAIVSDTLGRADTADITVHIDPTPPFPEITQPLFGQDVCDGIQSMISISDEDISYMTFETKSITSTTVLPIPIINQNLGGDTNGNPADGNPASSGEFGDYCSGPAVGAMALKYWASKGYDAVIKEGITTLTDTQLIDRLFSGMHVADNLGTYDEEFISGLRQYLLSHGGGFDIHIDRTPQMANVYTWAFDYDFATMLGLSGSPGRWLIISGVSGLEGTNDQYLFKLTDPATGTTADYAVKEESGKIRVEYFGTWLEVDIMVGLVPSNWNPGRTSIGYDGNGGDGWGILWNTSSLARDKLHFLYVSASDNANHTGYASVIVKNDCNGNGTPGDINGDDTVNPADLVYLINFLYMNGPIPPNGNTAANVNGDSSIDVSDVIYLYRYLFLGGPAPL